MGLMRVVPLLAALLALAAAQEEGVRTQPVKDWENCKECGKKLVDPRFRGYTSGNFHSKFHGNWFKDEGKGAREWYGTAEARQRPAPKTVPVTVDVLRNKDVFTEDNTADDFHSDKSTRPADVSPDLGLQAALNATGNAINENVVKPAASLLPNISLPDLQSERHRTTKVQRSPITIRPTPKVVPCNKTNGTKSSDQATAAVLDGIKPFKPCAPGGCDKKEKYTKCVKDPVKLPTEEQRTNTDAPQGGQPAVMGAGNDTFVRKCRSNWWPHPMCMSENVLVQEMMPRGMNDTNFQPSSQGDRAAWLEAKTRAASNCAMCENLVEFKVAEDALTAIDCGATTSKKMLAVEQRRTMMTELAELKVELKEAQWNVTHNETIPECPYPCTTPRTDTMPIRQQKVTVAKLKIQRKEEAIERTNTAIVMLADLEAACPRLREHFEQFELEVRAEMSERTGEKMAAREICRKITCCTA